MDFRRLMSLRPQWFVMASCFATAAAAAEPSLLAPLPPPGERYFFVATETPAADDSNDGSLASPWKTLSHAAERAEPGDTVWIRGGVYRETVRVHKSGAGIHRRIAFRALPGEAVVVNGADVLSGWQRAANEPDRPIWETDWPFAGIYPGMVACDGAPLRPMSIPAATEELKPPKEYCQYFLGFGRGQADMKPGAFCYNEPRKKLLVWLLGDEDPNRHVMEAAVRACWESAGNYLLVEGLVFRYSPLVVPIGGVVFTMTGPGGGLSPAEGCVVRNCEVSHGAFEGMRVRGGKEVTTVIEDCWIHHNGNGCGGFEGHGEPNSEAWLVVRRCRLTDNNLFNWNPAWHAGGKHFGRRVFFDECEFARHYHSPGLWFDIHQRDCIVNRCYAHHNGQFQLYYEIGETGAFVNNVVEGAPHCCTIAFNGTSRSLIAHNAVVAYERGIIVGWEGNAEGQVSRVTCYNSVFNNLLLGRGWPLLTVSPEYDLARGNVSDHNFFWQPTPPEDAGPPDTWKLFENSYVDNTPVSLSTWQATRQLDLASRIVDPQVDTRGGRFSSLPAGPTAAGGKRLTEDEVRKLFAVRPMPVVASESLSSSVKDHQPPSEAFLRKVTELLHVAEGSPVPLGPLPNRGVPAPRALQLANSSFETPPLADNRTDPVTPGWTVTEGRPGSVGVWRAMASGLWNWYPPDGHNILFLNGTDHEASSTTLSQSVQEAFSPDTRYRLSVWAGQQVNHAHLPWPKVTLALHAGRWLLKSVDIPRPEVTPHVGIWAENVLTFTSPPQVPRDARLKMVLTRVGAGAQACFDEIRLEATALTR